MSALKHATVATIGFTKTTAEHFFQRIKAAKVKLVIDVRLHNTSQLAGFAKADDLAFFLRSIAGVDYLHHDFLAPTEAILAAYKKEKGDWSLYRKRFLDLMRERGIERRLTPANLDGACLLCSEATAEHCHRGLVLEYLADKWKGALAVRHL
jgi:uncharacterized protein (DUF488 family)